MEMSGSLLIQSSCCVDWVLIIRIFDIPIKQIKHIFVFFVLYGGGAVFNHQNMCGCYNLNNNNSLIFLISTSYVRIIIIKINLHYKLYN